MKRIAIMGLTLVAVLAINVSGAMAHTFLSSSLGTIKDHNLNTHVFKTTAGNVECKTLKSTGTVVALATKTQVDHVSYTGCTAYGTKATISEAEYEFNAEGSVSVLNTIVVTSSTGGCSVKVTPTGNSGLKTVKYSNTGKKVIITAEVVGITYSVQGPTGSVCGNGGVTESNGVYKGLAEVELENGGMISWE
jgi:hypothetical protein